jgi:DNA-binding transcriptional LysR family regulator
MQSTYECAGAMNIEIRQLRALVAVIKAGSFTDAAIELGSSQATVSRNVVALELSLGVRLIHRTTRSVELTPAGERTVRHARWALSILEDLEQDARTGGSAVRIGYAWSAQGGHTTEFQGRWAAAVPDTELLLIRTNNPTAGLADGKRGFAILRREPTRALFGHALIGVERCYCAMSAADTLARKRTVTLAEIASCPLALGLGTGSTGLDLWPEDRRPTRTVVTHDVDDWLTVIGSGSARGVTPESTAQQQAAWPRISASPRCRSCACVCCVVPE